MVVEQPKLDVEEVDGADLGTNDQQRVKVVVDSEQLKQEAKTPLSQNLNDA